MSKLRDRLTQKKKELSERSQGGAWVSIKEGTNRVRHLPCGEDKEFAIEVIYFYLGGKIMGVISPKSLGKKCAIMNKYNELSASKDPADRELAAKFKPQKRYMSPVISFKDKDGKELDDRGPKLILLTSNLYEDILELFLDEQEAGDFTDPKNGYDLKYLRTGKGKMDTKYKVIKCKETKLTKKFADKEFSPEEMLSKIVPTYEETKAMIKEFLNAPPEDDEKPSKKSSSDKKKKKKKSKDL